MSSKRLAPLIVLSGPSGVGKTTIVDRLLEHSRMPLRRAITATSRVPRPGEQDGIHYHFWTPEQFRAAIASGDMLEHAIVHGRDFYGTPRSEVDPYRAQGTGVILVIDVQGAAQVRKQNQTGQFSVFLMVSDFDNLRRRLKARGESPETIEQRLRTANREIERAGEFDCRILNDDLTAAVHDLEAAIRDRFPTTEE